ncbi:MAG TPA: hypothetical protein VLK84_24440 [Longimicrobium sp.]|nr:hypothetical protein [Longimicrobium sp.]
MRISIQRFLTLFAWAAVLTGAALPAGAASAQVEAPREASAPSGQRSFCWTGRPAESCRTFLVAEGNVYAPVAGTTYLRTGFQGDVARERHLAPHVAWEVGAMRNVGPRDAVGAAVLLGADANGERLALKGRYRRWLGPGAAVDAAAGVLYARRAAAYPDVAGNVHVPGAGVTADVSLGLTDWAGVSVRGDLLFDEDQRSSAVYGGLKLGTRPAAAATVAPLLFGVALAVLMGGAGG